MWLIRGGTSGVWISARQYGDEVIDLAHRERIAQCALNVGAFYPGRNLVTTDRGSLRNRKALDFIGVFECVVRRELAHPVMVEPETF